MDTFHKVVAAIKDTMPSSWKTSSVTDNIIPRQWVDLIWNHSSTSQLTAIENLPLIPVQKGHQKYYRLLQCNPKVMLSIYQGKSSITDSIKNLLVENSVEFVAENLLPKIALNNQQFLREYILLPNENGILSGLRYLNYHLISLSDEFCVDFQNIIENVSDNIPSYIYDMKIFTDIRGKKVSIEESYIVEKKDVPPGFIESLCNVSLVLTTNITHRLHEKLSFNCMVFNNLTRKYLSYHKILTIADSRFFIEKISSIRNIDNDILSKLRSKVQIRTDSGNGKFPDSVFERTTQTEAFFYHESDIFPDKGYNIPALRKLGLKSELHIAEPDIIARIDYASRNYTGMHKESYFRKIKAILNFCAEKSISVPQSTKWILLEKVSPPKYPALLLWRAESENVVIESFQNIYPWQYYDIVGSTSYIVSQSLSALFSKLTCKRPSLNEVLTHLQNVVQAYNDDERGLYKKILMEIYKYLGETFPPNQVANKWKQLNLKIWLGNRFVEPTCITSLVGCLDLSPYIYSSKGCFPDSFGNILTYICDQNKTKIDMYIHVLTRIKQRYDNTNEHSVKDLALAIKILCFIADNYSKLNTVQRGSICIPIEHTFLKLCNIKECFHHEYLDGLTVSDVKQYKITHRDLGNKNNKIFEIPDLVSEILNDGENDLFEEWGQTEPLTLRLKQLLKDYEDGLPIFKELIQNADDAKATEISFLYDERSNDHLKSSLIDQSMKQWQGPALWVHNDAVFTKEDFENIRRLNAGTKETDTTKIGKFGLGFSAVYHLTDVPCFLSGNYVVYFDPHSKYLGRALRSKSECGKRIDLRKNKALIPFNDQFKIFDGIFEARIDFKERNFETYNHTLFRLPLRSHETASKSDICNLNYTSHEMKLLLEKLKQSLETLILFTENISKVCVYHLERNASPSQITLMFRVRKETKTRCSSLTHQNLLVSATKQTEVETTTTQSDEDSLASTRVVDIDMIHYLNENLKSEPIKETWLQLAFVGSKKNIKFAKVNKGLVPCGGLAINYRKSEKKFEIVTDKNRVFCFLPLPKEINLPVSVNGTFLITNDRKQLAVNSDEAKRNTDDWNLMLAADIGCGYFDLLLYLKNTYSQWKIDDWFGLFPKSDQVNHDAVSNAILYSLVDHLIHSGKQIFPVANKKDDVVKWVKWEDICGPPKMLHFMNHDILVFMNWYFEQYNTAKVCMNLPSKVKLLVKSYAPDNTLDNYFLKEDTLFKIFFNSLSSVPKKNADKLMIAILNQQPQIGSKLREYLESTKCIPTLPYGKLKRPQDLVKTSSIVAELYDTEDEVFPCEEYISKHDLFLQTLGMSTDYLQWDKIIHKATEIAANHKNKNDKLLINRSKILVKLMTCALDKCTDDQKTEITQIKFLPVRSAPQHTNQIHYYGHGKIFCSAVESYTSQYINIVSSSAPILDFDFDKRLAKFLGVDRVPTFQQAMDQIKAIELKYRVLTDRKETKEICDMLYALFTFLSGNYQAECSSELFVSKSIIYDNDRKNLVTPTQIFFDSSDEFVKVPGYIYKVATDLRCDPKIKSFLQNIGVKESPGISGYIMVLQNIKADYKRQPVPKPILKVIINSIIPKVAEELKFLENNEDIHVPDDAGIMQKTTDVCYKDVNWIGNTENYSFVHPEVSHVHCEHLKIEILRTKHFLEYSVGLSLGHSFGQHEDLTNRIKNLLRGYTEEDVIKELLQNADDSDATEVEFILDHRNHETKKIFSDKWEKLQGPALIITNNGKFTENDLDAIQKLGEGNKSRDRLKTGRYGVGFNAVYNITDCPTLHVRLKDEACLCIFDPHLHYIIGGTVQKPGRKIDSAVLKEDYEDIYEAHLLTENNLTNTLFRLPLRTKEMAKKSKISNKEVTVQNIERHFEEVYQYVGEMLLFLVNIRKIRFSILKVENNELKKSSEEFSIFAYDFTKSDFDRKSKTILEYARNPYSKSVTTVSYKTCVQHVSNSVNCCKKHYLLVEQIGFSEIKASQNIKCYESREFFTFPKGAVANSLRGVPCSNSHEGKCISCKLKGKTHGQVSVQNVFCTLPISITSGLPVLVNGNFLLEYETRRELWLSLSGPEREWNFKILSQCVLPCYIFLLNQFKEDAKQQKEIYKFFPEFIEEKEKNYWHYFSFLFYQEVFRRNEEILPVACNNKKLCFSRPQDQFIVYVEENIKYSRKPALLAILQAVGLHIDLIPARIVKNFEESGNPLSDISPALIRQRLKGMSEAIIFQNFLHIKQSCFKDASSLATVLEYCMKDVNRLTYFSNAKEELVGLPLCLLADDTLSFFSEKRPVFVSPFSSIFQRNQAMFVHKQLVSILENYNFPNILRSFKLQDFAEMLPDELNQEEFKGNFIIEFNAQNKIGKTWLKTVWEFLKRSRRDLQGHLEEWLLLLARLNSVEFLLPVSQRTSVLYIEAAEDKSHRVIGVLRELPVYEVAEGDFVDHNHSPIYQKAVKIYPQEFKKDFFGSINRIEDLENALLLSQDHNELKLSLWQARIILDHIENLWFNEHCYLTKIHNLPIFIKYDDTLTKIEREAVVLPESDIPYDGLDVIEELMQITFIKAGYPTIFKKVGCQVVTICKFYIGFIFPRLLWLPVPAILKHMDYIKLKFSGPISFHSEKDEVKTFIKRLSNLKFMPVQEGVFRAPSELFDPHVKLFELVFKNEHFPPSHFRKGSWLNFLRNIGLITGLSKQLAIQIANLIQDVKNEEVMLEASKMLCEKIKMRAFLYDENFLYQIRCIDFLKPKQVEEINETIFSSLNQSTSRMCYFDSVHCSQENLVWTSKLILPNYACCFESRDTYAKLGVKQGLKGKKFRDEPRISFQDVLKHIDNLTNNANYKARTMTCKTIPKAYREQYKRVLKEFYDFLQLSRPLEYKHVELLSQRSVIIVNDNADLDIPGRSNLSNQMTLTPYINEVNVTWGQYFELFEEMGCQQSSNASQFFDVLKEIKMGVKEKHLNPNELAIVSKAVTNVSSLLRNSPLSNTVQTQVYLPCIKHFHPEPLEPVYLLSSSELIYINDYHMQERMKDFEGNFMLPKYEGVEDARNVNEILSNGLPARNMPKLLSELVQEVLKKPILEIEAPTEHFSKKLSTIFSSISFFHGLERLAKYEYKARDKNLSELENIFKVIQSAKISVLQRVQTNLICNGKVISTSETDKEVYTTVTKNSLKIYLQVGELTEASAKVALGILDLLRLHSIELVQSKNVIVLEKLLEIQPKAIPKLLDSFGIPRETLNAEVRLLPTPGNFVPQTWYPFLSNSFEKFEVGEFVAINQEFEDAECYVYGIIRGCKNEESVHISQLTYDVQVDEDPTNLVKFKDFDLYGFDRLVQSAVSTKEIVKSDSKERREQTEIPLPQSYEEAVKEIRGVLRSLSDLDEESKKKVIRKLYLKWHPDKHEERHKDFATRIFQFLRNELNSDHKDMENNFDSWNSSARTYSYSKRSNSAFFHHGNDSSPNFHNGSRSSQNFHYGRNSSPNFSFFFKEQSDNPQPTQSKRWYRQAEKDLQAAKDRKEQHADSFFQWHCFMAKQVCRFSMFK